jgi:hypothetical protein
LVTDDAVAAEPPYYAASGIDWREDVPTTVPFGVPEPGPGPGDGGGSGDGSGDGSTDGPGDDPGDQRPGHSTASGVAGCHATGLDPSLVLGVSLLALARRRPRNR